jgi:hypothetical protein
MKIIQELRCFLVCSFFWNTVYANQLLHLQWLTGTGTQWTEDKNMFFKEVSAEDQNTDDCRSK